MSAIEAFLVISHKIKNLDLRIFLRKKDFKAQELKRIKKRFYNNFKIDLIWIC